MAFDINNPYLKHKVMTASPQELRLLLIDGAIHFTEQGREGLATKDFEKVYEGFTQAKAIVMELMTSLDHSVAPDLCARLQSLYAYIYKLLIEASFHKDEAKASEARERLEFERETWVQLMEQLVAEGAAASNDDAPSAGDVRTASAPARAPLSVQG
jgi:flagellar secretion chaperone FliS